MIFQQRFLEKNGTWTWDVWDGRLVLQIFLTSVISKAIRDGTGETARLGFPANAFFAWASTSGTVKLG